MSGIIEKIKRNKNAFMRGIIIVILINVFLTALAPMTKIKSEKNWISIQLPYYIISGAFDDYFHYDGGVVLVGRKYDGVYKWGFGHYCKDYEDKSKWREYCSVTEIGESQPPVPSITVEFAIFIAELAVVSYVSVCISDKNPKRPKSPSANTAEELKKYKDLLDAGAITEEEFEEKKNQLLNM